MASAGTVQQRRVAWNALTSSLAAGFPESTAQTFMRIASRESGFDPNAHALDADDDSYGLWQINTLGNLWVEVRAYGIVNEKSELFTPAKNARVARAMYDRYGFRPWQINGDHLAGTLPWSELAPGLDDGWSPGDVVDVAGSAAGAATGAVTDIPGALNRLADILATPFKFAARILSVVLDPRFWKRLGLGVLGLGVIVLGVLVWRARGIRRTVTAGEPDADEPASLFGPNSTPDPDA